MYPQANSVCLFVCFCLFATNRTDIPTVHLHDVCQRLEVDDLTLNKRSYEDTLGSRVWINITNVHSRDIYWSTDIINIYFKVQVKHLHVHVWIYRCDYIYAVLNVNDAFHSFIHSINFIKDDIQARITHVPIFCHIKVCLLHVNTY